MDRSNMACHLGTGVGVVAFLGAIGFLAGEFFIEKIPNIQFRKYFIISDLIFSGCCSLSYLVSFCSLAHHWSGSDPSPAGYGHTNMGAAIFFSFSSVPIWAVSSLLAGRKYKEQFEVKFGNFDTGFTNGGGVYNTYGSGEYQQM